MAIRALVARGRSALISFLAASTVVAFCTPVHAQTTMTDALVVAADPAYRIPLQFQKDSYFFVTGSYVPTATGVAMRGQMYVHVLLPTRVTHRYPIIMMHGAGQTGTNFEGTPDGREGWAQYFTRHGYAVYVVDQVGRARSAYGSDVYGAYAASSVTLTVEHQFTAPERFNLWPQAHLHTQWPGSGPNKGLAGNPIFDQFFASQVPDIADPVEQELLNKSASGALLDLVGPAIVLSHSQSGAFGWQFADARPKLVKAIVAIEPSGPPFYSITNIGPPSWYVYSTTVSRPYGITTTPITYSPAITSPAQLVQVKNSGPQGPGLVTCYKQGNPVHKLTTLQGKAILMVTSQASYHSQYDDCTSAYLSQAGVTHDHIHLPDAAIYGNGHMMMIEKGNIVIAQLIDRWLQNKGL